MFPNLFKLFNCVQIPGVITLWDSTGSPFKANLVIQSIILDEKMCTRYQLLEKNRFRNSYTVGFKQLPVNKSINTV